MLRLIIEIVISIFQTGLSWILSHFNVWSFYLNRRIFKSMLLRPLICELNRLLPVWLFKTQSSLIILNSGFYGTSPERINARMPEWTHASFKSHWTLIINMLFSKAWSAKITLKFLVIKSWRWMRWIRCYISCFSNCLRFHSIYISLAGIPHAMGVNFKIRSQRDIVRVLSEVCTHCSF